MGTQLTTTQMMEDTLRAINDMPPQNEVLIRAYNKAHHKEFIWQKFNLIGITKKKDVHRALQNKLIDKVQRSQDAADANPNVEPLTLQSFDGSRHPFRYGNDMVIKFLQIDDRKNYFSYDQLIQLGDIFHDEIVQVMGKPNPYFFVPPSDSVRDHAGDSSNAYNIIERNILRLHLQGAKADAMDFTRDMMDTFEDLHIKCYNSGPFINGDLENLQLMADKITFNLRLWRDVLAYLDQAGADIALSRERRDTLIGSPMYLREVKNTLTNPNATDDQHA